MTPDTSTFMALGALVVVSVLLFFTLRQALGERGRAGVARIIDFFMKPKQKEVPHEPDHTA